jgi:hypothetical protein
MASNPPISNRRRVPRREFKSGVGVLYQGHYTVGRTLQVGEGGMSLTSEFAYRDGDLVVITFQIPEGSLVCTRAVVRYTKSEAGAGPTAIGFEFEKLDFHFKRELRNFVARATQENISF